MNDEPTFTRPWRATAIISLLTGIAGAITATLVSDAPSKNEPQVAEMEKTIRQIEDLLYSDVAGQREQYEEKTRQAEQRLAEIEKALKDMKRPQAP